MEGRGPDRNLSPVLADIFCVFFCYMIWAMKFPTVSAA